ncbi:MAG: glycosyltransferase [Aureispira sp.]|nr:glycosyltransferase [Aureispira sp.]
MSNELPLVSIVALCYNHAKYLEEALNSIANQSYANIQLIIVDDRSSDNSVELIQNWIDKNNIDCLFLPHEKNKGLCGSLNHGLKYIKGTYYQFLACDDVMLLEKIEKQVKVLETNPNLAVVHSNGYNINEHGVIGEKLHAKPLFTGDSKIVFKALLSENRISAPAVLIRTEMLPKAPVYDESSIFEDWALWLKLAKNYDFHYINEPLVHYRVLSTSMIRTEHIRKQVGVDAIAILEGYMGGNSEQDTIITKSIARLKEQYDLYDYTLGALLTGKTSLRKFKEALKFRTRIKNYFNKK